MKLDEIRYMTFLRFRTHFLQTLTKNLIKCREFMFGKDIVKTYQTV